MFTKILSKDYNQYKKRDTLENGALRQLELNVEYLTAGEVLQYIIIDYNGRKSNRVTPSQLLKYNKTNYDVKRYSKLLIDTGNTVLEPVGIVLDRIYNNYINRQLLLIFYKVLCLYSDER